MFKKKSPDKVNLIWTLLISIYYIVKLSLLLKVLDVADFNIL